MNRAGWRAALLLAGILVATSCGSTVPAPVSSPGQNGAPAAGGGLSIPPASTGGGGGTTAGGGSSLTGGGVSSGSTSAGGGTTSGNGTAGGGGGRSSSGHGTAAASGSVPGITATTIYVGARYLQNQGAANSAIGAGGAGGGDARDAYKAVIDEVNRQGGIAGRRVVPVYAPLDATSNTPAEQQRQANCSTWTEDNEVFVIFAGGNGIDEECAKQAGALEFYGNLALGATLPATFEEYPHYVEIIGMNLVRMGQATVNGLQTQGYFNRGAKIGAITWDDPAYREALQKGYIRTMADHGLSLATDPVYLSPPQTLQDLSNMSSQVNSAVLKFSTAGIDHVMMLDGATGGVCGVGCMGFEFMRRAQAQRYYPRYGFNDNNIPAAGYAAGFYPADELSGSVSVGWDDIDKSYDAGWHVNQTRERCFSLMRKNGVDLGDVNARGAALEACDELWFLRMVVAKMGAAALTPDNVIAAVNTLGSSFVSTQTYGTSFSTSKHDGVDLVRNYHWVDSCTCFKYTSTPYRP